MKKKYIASLIIPLCFTQCSSCKKDDDKKNNDIPEQKIGHITELKSAVGGFRDPNVRRRLDDMVRNFEELIANAATYPAVNVELLNNVIQMVTKFLQTINNKPGEDIANKTKILTDTVNIYLENIIKNYCVEGDVKNEYLAYDQSYLCSTLTNFLQCLTNASSADEVQTAVTTFHESLRNFGARSTKKEKPEREEILAPSELIELVKEQFKDTNYEVNKIAIRVLCGLLNANLKEHYEKLKKDFDTFCNKDVSKVELERLTEKTNTEIAEGFKEKILQSVKDVNKDVKNFKPIWNGIYGDLKFWEAPEGNPTEKQLETFFGSFADMFEQTWDHCYGFSFKQVGEHSYLHFNLCNFEKEKDPFTVNIEQEFCPNSLLQVGVTKEGVNYLFLREEKSNFMEDGSKNLTHNDQIFLNILDLSVRLSAGFSVKRGGVELNKMVACEGDVLFEDVADPFFGVVDSNITDKSKLHECLNFIRYTKVVNLWERFIYTEQQLEQNLNSADNRKFYQSLWGYRNVCHCIHSSSKDQSSAISNNFSGKILSDVNASMKDFWGDDTTNGKYKDKVVANQTKIQLALAEYLIVRCGAFRDNVHLVADEGGNVKIGKDLWMGIDGWNTRGVWSKDISVGYDFSSQSLCPLADVGFGDDELKEVFAFDKTILDGAKLMCEKVLNVHMNNSKPNSNYFYSFLKNRGKLHDKFSQGIWGIRNCDELINFVKSFIDVAQEANKLPTRVNSLNNSLLTGIAELLKNTYRSSNGTMAPILRYVETGLATSNKFLLHHMAAYHIKFIENALQGKVYVDCKPTKLVQTLVKLDSVEDVEKIDLEKIWKDHLKEGNRWVYMEGPKGEGENLVSSLKSKQSYVEEGQVGLNDIAAKICNYILTPGNVRNPKLPQNPPKIETWFRSLKIHIYSIKADSRLLDYVDSNSDRLHFLYVGDKPVNNVDEIDKKLSNGQLTSFIIPRKFTNFGKDITKKVEDFDKKTSNVEWSHMIMGDQADISFDSLDFLDELWGNESLVAHGFLFSFDYPGQLFSKERRYLRKR